MTVKYENIMYKTELTEEEYNEITAFITKKRLEIMFVLFREGELPHSKMAQMSNTTVTSCSNIMAKFDECVYKLIECRQRGKYNYYSLTELGKAYMNSLTQRQEDSIVQSVIQHEELCLLQQAKETLQKFQKIDEENWEIRFDDRLLERCNGWKNEENEENELIDEYIRIVEVMILKEYETSMDKLIKMLSTVLRGRLEKFLEDFYAIEILLKSMNDRRTAFEAYELLVAIADGDRKMIEAYVQLLDWKENGNKLIEAIERIYKRGLQYETKEDMYCYFNRYIPENYELSLFMVNLLWKR